jgi:hypothetical protein
MFVSVHQAKCTSCLARAIISSARDSGCLCSWISSPNFLLVGPVNHDSATTRFLMEPQNGPIFSDEVNLASPHRSPST